MAPQSNENWEEIQRLYNTGARKRGEKSVQRVASESERCIEARSLLLRCWGFGYGLDTAATTTEKRKITYWKYYDMWECVHTQAQHGKVQTLLAMLERRSVRIILKFFFSMLLDRSTLKLLHVVIFQHMLRFLLFRGLFMANECNLEFFYPPLFCSFPFGFCKRRTLHNRIIGERIKQEIKVLGRGKCWLLFDRTSKLSEA